MGAMLGNIEIEGAALGDKVLFETNGWHLFEGSSEFFSLFTMFYRINESEKYLDIAVNGMIRKQIGAGSVAALFDLSSIVSGISKVILDVESFYSGANGWVTTISDGKISLQPSLDSLFNAGQAAVTVGRDGNQFARVYYTELV